MGIILKKRVTEKGLVKKTKYFHTSVARGTFVAKRARPEIHQTVAVLSTRVKEPN